MTIKTPVSNLSVSGTLNVNGDIAVNGNAVVSGTIVLGQTEITEQSFNELVYAASQPGCPGPQGNDGGQGPPGPAGELTVQENDSISTSILGYGTKGDVAFGAQDGAYYLYICIDSGNWGRIALDTNF
jgi:hypothetical protein